jgi:hypothetical protein
MHREKRRASSLHAALYNDGTEGGGGGGGLATISFQKASATSTTTHHQLPTEPRNDKGAHPLLSQQSPSLPQKQPRLDQQQQLQQQKLNRDSVLQQSKEPMKKFSQPVFKSDISHTFKPVVVPNQNLNQTNDLSGVTKAPAKAGKKNAINNNNVNVAVLMGTVFEQQAKSLFPKAKIRSVEKPATGYQEVLANRAQVTITSNVEAATLIKNYPDLQVVGSSADMKNKRPFAYPVVQGDAVWVTFLNNWIALKEAEGYFTTLETKWLSSKK